MASMYVSFSWNREDEQLPEYLRKNKLQVIHKYRTLENVERLMPGMALKHESGVIMRVITRVNNYENCSHDYLLASKTAKDQHLELFSHG